MSAARMVFNEVDNDARVIAMKARMIETARQFFKVAKDAPSDDERAEVLADRMPARAPMGFLPIGCALEAQQAADADSSASKQAADADSSASTPPKPMRITSKCAPAKTISKATSRPEGKMRRNVKVKTAGIKSRGTRKEVFEGKANQTKWGLTKDDFMKGKKGNIVSKKVSSQSKHKIHKMSVYKRAREEVRANDSSLSEGNPNILVNGSTGSSTSFKRRAERLYWGD